MKISAILRTVAAIAIPLMLVSTAWAHHPTITAAASCDPNTNSFVISYTSTSWSSTPVEGENPNILIGFNDAVVDNGAYIDPNYSFSRTLPAPLNAVPGASVLVTAYAAAAWGDGWPAGDSQSISITIPDTACSSRALGRMTGGGSQVRLADGIRITKGLTIHCDLLLSNNLEVNWGGGNNFHMLDHIQTVACIDTPVIQTPPAAPFDTLIGKGTGRFNNVDGYSIEFTFVDAGEPGTFDQASLLIYETANPGHVVLNLPLQTITGGNLQAHYDQPHK